MSAPVGAASAGDAPLDLLRGITREVAGAGDLQGVLQSIVDGLVTRAGVTLAHIFLLTDESGCPACRARGEAASERALHLAAGAGPPFGVQGPVHRVAHDAGVPSASLIWSRQPVMLQEVADDARWNAEPAMRDLLRALGLRGLAIHPLEYHGEVLGAIGCLTREPLHPHDFELLGIFADQAAMAIRSAQLVDELRRYESRLQDENTYLQDEIRAGRGFDDIVGTSAAMRAVLRQVRQVAGVGTTVLLTGETGTGKELLARAVHAGSPRRARALIKLNCGAIPAGVVESELFGHEKGAFTGALQRRLGRFELADQGTLFLDEVGELPLETQVKLLRVLQERELERVGGSGRPIPVDVRLVAATHRDLAREVAQGRFRADLFYRLNVFPIRVPPLRERPEDLGPLVQHFLAQFQRKLGKPLRSLAPASQAALARYAWPGNIRELQNVLERACVLATGPVVSVEEVLQPVLPGGEHALAPMEIATLDDAERAHIRRALEAAGGRVHGPKGAAVLLGINASTLRSRMKKLGIDKVT